MSAVQSSAFCAIAMQLVAALEAYEQDVDRLLSSHGSPELYQHVSRQVDQMRMYAAALPQASVPWVELLIRHFELTHGLWRQRQGKSDAAEMARLLAQQRAAVAILRQRCIDLAAKA